MRFIWATRGHDWGFTFINDGGLADPLPTYEAAFSGADPTLTALRLPDPEGRTDRAGRRIEHDFVLFDPEDATDPGAIWQQVAEEYARRY